MPRAPIHPGKFLADEQEALGMTPTQLAAALKAPPNRIYQLLAGKRALTADTALRLSQWLGTSAEMWLNLQKLYELRLPSKPQAKKSGASSTPCLGLDAYKRLAPNPQLENSTGWWMTHVR